MDYWKNYGGYLYDSTQHPAQREYDPGKGDIAFSPMAGAVYHITEDTSARAKVGRAFRIPTLYDLYRTWRSSTTTYMSNPGLSPEQTYSYEIGLDNTFKNKLLTRATFYFNDVTGLIYSLGTVQGISAKDNIGRVAIYGMEIENRYALNDNFSVFCNYTWNRSRIIKQINQALEDNDLAYTPRNKLSYGTSLKIPKMFDFNFMGWYNGRMFNDEANRNKLKEIFVFDLTASGKLTDFFEVSIKMENLFDRRYQEYSGVLAPPRAVTINGKITF
jgi:iron complex outermembrane receptor protein